MKKLIVIFSALMATAMQSHAIDNNTVEIVYNGSTATVAVANNISSYVTISSGTSSNVVIVQNSSFAGVDATDTNTSGEITYILSGSSSAGSFQLTGSYKCTISLAGLTLTNGSGPALNIQDGKRIKLSAKKETTNTIAGAGSTTYNGAIFCKGHLEIQGNGTLNVSSTGNHAIKAKEYVQIKNLTLNITSAAKDGINCQEYFWMKSGTVTISGVASDGIDVTKDASSTATGEIAATSTVEAHEDENSGNFYLDDGTLTISLASGNTSGSLIAAEGAKQFNGGTYNGTSYGTGIEEIENGETKFGAHGESQLRIEKQGSAPTGKANYDYYNLQGQRVDSDYRGVVVIKGKKVKK